MIGLIVTFLICLLGLVLLFFFFLPRDRSAQEDAEHTHELVAGLSSASTHNLSVLFRNDDYLTLLAVPELRSVRKRFWCDRRRIALLWLAELQNDVTILWEFHRFGVRNGLPVTLREEGRIAFASLSAFVCLRVVRVAVFLMGPFSAFRALKNAKLLVEELRDLGGTLLTRVPDPKKGELQQRWAHHLGILRAG